VVTNKTQIWIFAALPQSYSSCHPTNVSKK